jgi:tripartite-type tricarboxylate transporter receptor subunit TctC
MRGLSKAAKPALAVLLPMWPASAEDLPTKSIRLIVPFPPAVPNDTVAGDWPVHASSARRS